MRTKAYSPNTWEDIFDALATDDASRLFVAKGRDILEGHRNSPMANDYLGIDVTPFDAARIDEAIQWLNELYEGQK